MGFFGHKQETKEGASRVESASASAAATSGAPPAGYVAASAPPAEALETGGPVPQKDKLTDAQRASLHRLQALAHLMDNSIKIPVLGYTVGVDAVIGLIPWFGDAAGTVVGTFLVAHALRFHLPKRVVARMMVNQAIDSCVGLVPFIGDLFDAGFKANTRNIRLLDAHLEKPSQAKRADACFLCSMFFLVVVVPFMLLACIIVAVIVGILAAVGKLF